MDEMERGIIRGVRVEGGMLGLNLESPETGRCFWVYGDNGPTVRALVACFGEQVVRNRMVIIDELIDKAVKYRITDYGALEEIACDDD